jgi:hypothetical protein
VTLFPIVLALHFSLGQIHNLTKKIKNNWKRNRTGWLTGKVTDLILICE